MLPPAADVADAVLFLPRCWLRSAKRAARQARSSLPASGHSALAVREANWRLERAGVDKDELARRAELLSSAQNSFDTLCEELHSAERDAAYWRVESARAAAGGPLRRLLPCLAADQVLLNAATVRNAQQQLQLSLWRAHTAARSLGEAAPVDTAQAPAAHEASPPPLPFSSLRDEAAGYPLGVVPRPARRPGPLRRAAPRVLLYSLAAGLAVRWLANRHAAGDLRRWAQSLAEALRGAASEHVAKPLRAVSDELFATFRVRQGLVSEEALDASRASLERQLAAFAKAHGGARESPDAAMAALNAYQEAAIRRPISGLLVGDLAWALLVQIAKLKVDGEAAMRSLDQILRANELNLTLVAALPALGAVSFACRLLASLLSGRRRLPPSEAQQELRRRFAQAERLVMLQADGGQTADSDPCRLGELLYLLDCAHNAAAALLCPDVRRTRRAAAAAAATLGAAGHSREEWEALQGDLLLLAAPGLSWRARLEHVQRVMRAHSFQYINK